MPFVDWDDSYSVAVAEFDGHHKRLFDLTNRLHEAIKNREGNQVIGDVITELANYTQTHFGREEQEMANQGYIEAMDHKRKHDEFVDKVLQFKADHDSGKLFLSTQVLDFLKEWLVKHIRDVDKSYSSFFNSRGIS